MHFEISSGDTTEADESQLLLNVNQISFRNIALIDLELKAVNGK